jgi:excisionase family DNA binding protein
MSEKFLTSVQASQLLGVNPDTMRRYLREGKVRALRLGRDWKIPESSLRDLARGGRLAKGGKPIANIPTPKIKRNPLATASGKAPHATGSHAVARNQRAQAILAGLDSDDPRTRNAAILALSQADEETSAIVEAEAARSVAEYSGPDEDWSDWRALDGEPFRFPEEIEEGAKT